MRSSGDGNVWPEPKNTSYGGILVKDAVDFPKKRGNMFKDYTARS